MSLEKNPNGGFKDEYRWEAVLKTGVVFDGSGRGEPTARGLGPIEKLIVRGPRLAKPFEIPIPGGCVPSMFHRDSVHLGAGNRPISVGNFFCGYEGPGVCRLYEFAPDKIRVHGQR